MFGYLKKDVPAMGRLKWDWSCNGQETVITPVGQKRGHVRSRLWCWHGLSVSCFEHCLCSDGNITAWSSANPILSLADCQQG